MHTDFFSFHNEELEKLIGINDHVSIKARSFLDT